MFTKFILISLFLFSSITACANLIQFNYKLVDPPLKSYTDKYLSLLEKHCPDGEYKKRTRYVIELQDDLEEPRWIGVCETQINGFRIAIRKSWWDRNNESDRTELIYHEMAHCMIYKDHEEKLPGHYMYPYFESIPETIYTEQAINDIKDYCEKGKK